MQERLIAAHDRLYAWPGPKRRQTVLSASLGRVMLTDRRLVFLSTGGHDVTVTRVAASAVSPVAGLRVSPTSHLDESALQNEGSVEIPLDRIDRCELKGLFKTMVIHYRNEDGVPGAVTLAPKSGSLPGGKEWIVEIDRARGVLVA